MSTRLEQAYQMAERINIDRYSKIVCMSDCHRGVGNRGDNFLPNQHLFLAALQYYYDRCFCYIELGDGDELWENRSLSRIRETHSDVFELLERFHQNGRFRMIYGNHDYSKRRGEEIFPGLCAGESILLTDICGGNEILLLHGHQGDLWNDTLAPLSGWLVRFLWRPLELLGIAAPTSAARNYKKREKAEKRLENFSQKKQLIVLAGHTHRAMLPKPGESLYWNDGSCVHPQGITAIELERGQVTLVKWHMRAGRNGILTVGREVLAGPNPWEAYYEPLSRQMREKA